MYLLDSHICTYLENSDIGIYSTDEGKDIFQNMIPTEPNFCIVVSITSTTPILTAGAVVGSYFDFMVSVRGTRSDAGYVAAGAKAQEIYDLLKLGTIVVEAVTYYNIRALTNVTPAGVDKNKRPIFTVSFTGLYTT